MEPAVVDRTSNGVAAWDNTVETSCNGTIFHRRSFLAYHRERFAGAARFLEIRDGGRPVALITLSIHDEDGQIVARAPYGGSYGGLVYLQRPSYAESRSAVRALLEYLRDAGVDQATFTPPPGFCSSTSLDLATFTLLEAGLVSINREISSVIPLGGSDPVAKMVSSRARRGSKRAAKAGVRVEMNAPLSDFWPVLEETFARHGSSPTHSHAELEWLVDHLPEHLWTDVAYLDSVPVAGVLRLRVNSRVAGSFYLCQTAPGRETQALTAVLLNSIETARSTGFRYFDLGTSTVGGEAREPVFEFKDQFASEGWFRETLRWTRPAGQGLPFASE